MSSDQSVNMSALIIYLELPENIKLFIVPDDVYAQHKETLTLCHGRYANVREENKDVENALTWLTAATQASKNAKPEDLLAWPVKLRRDVALFAQFEIECDPGKPFMPEGVTTVIISGIIL